MTGVPWRRAILAVVAAVLALTGVVVALRADGYPAIDATHPARTRWFVDETNGRAVLADGFSGQTLARIDVPGEPNELSIAQSASGVAVLDRSSATVRTIDTAALLLGPPQSLSVIAAPDAVVGVGQAGIVGFDPLAGRGVLLPPDGDQVPFELGDAADPAAHAGRRPTGRCMTFAAGALHRITTTADDVLETALPNAEFTLVGASPLVFDTDRRRVRLDDGDWVRSPGRRADQRDRAPASRARTPTAAGSAGDDHLWCVGEHGFVEDVEIAGLGIDGADLLSIAGNAGALVRQRDLDDRAHRLEDGDDRRPRRRPMSTPARRCRCRHRST